jgi:anti-sigma factor RsiW
VDCGHIAELAPLYVAGELAAARAAEFDAHLKTCSSCFRDLETQARLDARLREVLLAEDVDVSRVNRRIRDMIAGGSREAAGTKTPPRRGGSPWVTAAMGIAAAFLLVVAGYLLIPGHVSQVYADAAEDHQMEVVDHGPRRWISDPDQITALAQQHGIDVAVPAELSSGYHLERAKICWLDGLSYLHLVYSDGAKEFSLFLRARDGEKLDGKIRGFSNGRLLRECASGSEHLSSFRTSHLNAVVVTTQSAAASLQYAKLASTAIQD